jgi:hypothetical protein
MKNKWLVLAMVFLFGFVSLPVFAGPTLGDGVYNGAASEQAMVSTALPTSVEQPGTAMGTLLAITLLITAFAPLKRMATGPANNVPERYDKVRTTGLLGNLRKLTATAMNSGRFKRQRSA